MFVLGVDATKTWWIAVALGDGKDPSAHHLPTIDAPLPITPVREAIEAQTHSLATRAAVARTGTGISQQAYALGRKILEVEQWLPSSPCVYEVHPEVSFAVLLDAPATASKRTWAGMVERRRALEAAGISLDRIDGVAAVRASVDDMLDAAVSAWSAARIAGGTARSFPDPPELDAAGRRIAIWA